MAAPRGAQVRVSRVQPAQPSPRKTAHLAVSSPKLLIAGFANSSSAAAYHPSLTATLADGRFAGSFCKQSSTICTTSSPQREGNAAGSEEMIFNTVAAMLLLWKGCLTWLILATRQRPRTSVTAARRAPCPRTRCRSGCLATCARKCASRLRPSHRKGRFDRSPVPQQP